MTWDVMRTHHQQKILFFRLPDRYHIHGVDTKMWALLGPRVQIKILCPSNEMILSTLAGRVFASLGVIYILDFLNLLLETQDCN